MSTAGRKVLIAVDNTEDSVYAFEWALKELYRDGDEFHICHVIPRMQFATMYGVPPVDVYPVADPEAYESVIKKAEQFITDNFLTKLSDHPNLKPIVHIVKSDVDTESVGHVLCKSAEQLGVTNLVVASHNKGIIKEFFMGSVAQFCVHHCKTAVTVVRR